MCVCVCQDVCPDDLTIKDRYHKNDISQKYRRGCLDVETTCYTLMMLSISSPGQNIGKILKFPLPGQILPYSMKTNIFVICDKWYMENLINRFRFRFGILSKVGNRTVIGIFKNLCIAHGDFNFTSHMETT